MAFEGGGGQPPRVQAGNAERALQALLIASVVLPILVFAGVSWVAYRQQFDAARDRLLRTLGGIHEHAVKVFETFELSARYVDEVLYLVSDDEIRADEKRYSARLRSLADVMPQLRDIWIVDAGGKPLVSGTVYPIPRDLDLSDREYFLAHVDDASRDMRVSTVLRGRAANLQFFSLSKRRAADDGQGFRGVMTIAVAPEYFSKYYATLPDQKGAVFALIREDGAVLVRYPSMAAPNPHLPPGAPLLTAMKAAPQSGIFIATSSIDMPVERMVAYRRLPRHDVYVVAGLATADIVSGWLRLMARYLLFGLPAALAIVALAWFALQRVRRETLAYVRLRDEVARRLSTERALVQAQKMEAVGRLTGGIAHDFNNLLTVILGNIDLLLRRLPEPDPRIGRPLDHAREATQRAANLVQRLLAFSRQHPQEVRVVDLNRLVRDMSELLQRTIGENITIETVLAAGLWKASIDPNQLESAILNLAVNARDAMPGGGKLTIETSNAYLDEDYAAAHGPDICSGQCVMVAVSDTGAGMSKEVIENAFEPFFTTKPKGVGTGLGLSTVYGFVRQSGGHIKIYSEPGHGTSIKMYFPRASEQDGSAREGVRGTAPEPAPESAQAETVLIVEDDEAVRRFSTEVLSDLGYRVLTAADAASALQLLDREPAVRLLFTDVVLPEGMNGRALAEEARKRRPDLLVLFTTGYTRNAIVHHGRLDPDVEVLMKPFTYDSLARKVRTIFDAATRNAEAV